MLARPRPCCALRVDDESLPLADFAKFITNELPTRYIRSLHKMLVELRADDVSLAVGDWVLAHAAAFDDIGALAQQCQFRDCSHGEEPGVCGERR